MAAFEGTEVPTGWSRRSRTPGGHLRATATSGRCADHAASPPRCRRRPEPGSPAVDAADHEGGQLLGAGHARLRSRATWRWAPPTTRPQRGGGTGDGPRLRALGITVDYAPVATWPPTGQPSLGIRAFGDDPARVGGWRRRWCGGSRRRGLRRRPSTSPAKATRGRSPRHVPVLDHDETGSKRSSSCRPCRVGRRCPAGDGRPLRGSRVHRRPGDPHIGEPGPA